jgi:hypothetical protein
MNIILDISNFQIGYIFFLNPKDNIIMDGIFSKIIYSNQYFTLNGIYLHFPIEPQSIDKMMNKTILKFYPSSPINLPLMQELSRLEYRIIEYYKQINQNKSSKKAMCLLTKMLYSGTLILYKENHFANTIKDKKGQYVVKISGIWETSEEIGITFKLVEMFQNV